MPDYQEMYLTMVRASEDAVNILIQAQQKAENIYLSTPEPDIKVLPTVAGPHTQSNKESPPCAVD